MNNPKGYALFIKNYGSINQSAKIVCYVLGSKIDTRYNEETKSGDTIRVIPMAYDLVLRRAQQRLFNITTKMEAVNPEVAISGDQVIDAELENHPLIGGFDTSTSTNTN